MPSRATAHVSWRLPPCFHTSSESSPQRWVRSLLSSSGWDAGWHRITSASCVRRRSCRGEAASCGTPPPNGGLSGHRPQYRLSDAQGRIVDSRGRPGIARLPAEGAAPHGGRRRDRQPALHWSRRRRRRRCTPTTATHSSGCWCCWCRRPRAVRREGHWTLTPSRASLLRMAWLARRGQHGEFQPVRSQLRGCFRPKMSLRRRRPRRWGSSTRSRH